MLLDTSTPELFPNKTDNEPESETAFVKKIEGMLAIAHHDQEDVARQFIEIGRMLSERKVAGKRDGSIPHGEWVPWLERNFPSVDGRDRVRKLQQYKQVAEYMDSGEEAKTKVSSLLPQGFDAVLNEVRRIQAEEKKPQKPVPLTEDVKGEKLRILVGDCRERMRELDEKSVHCCITSPPYFGLRSYLSNFDYVDRPKGNDVRRWVNTNEKSVWGGDKNCEHEWTTSQRPGMAGMSSRERVRGTHGFDASEHSLCQKCGAWYGALGLEPTPELYVEHTCEVFDEAWRVIRDDGTLWLVIGDSYNTKNLLLIPARVALALQARGWILRSDIIWRKNGTPESVTDRPTKSHEHVFLFAKQENYYYDGEAIKEPAVSIDDPRKGNRTTYNGKFGNKAFAVVSPDNKRNCRDVWKIPIEPFDGGQP